jgi:tetratricopeptide (TPR) repeat protein
MIRPGALKSYRYAIRIYPARCHAGCGEPAGGEKRLHALLLFANRWTIADGARIHGAYQFYFTGVYYARTGNQQKAMNAFNTCIANDFNYVEAYMEKGFLYYDGKKIPEALQVFRTLSMVKKPYPDAYYWIAKCYEAMNNPAEAKTNYQRALALDPKLNDASVALKRLD